MESITFFEIEAWEQEYISRYISGYTLHFTRAKAHEVSEAEYADSTIISPFIYSKLTRETIERFPNLKLIATRSTGYDHIDVGYCREKGITVVHVPSYGAHTVAEHTFALLLALSRKIITSVERSKHGNFTLDGLQGFDLHGKTFGVVGEGEIGKKVIDLACAFGMKVLVYTRHPSGHTREHVTYVGLDDLLHQSDVVSLHVPFTPETHHLIHRENIKKFKPGSILLNTSRGQLVETLAILDGLQTGILRAVGLDVLEEEGSLKEERELVTTEFIKRGNLEVQLANHMLLNRDDVIFTSHNAFNSAEALQEILDVTVKNITQFTAGTPQCIVL